MQGSKNVMDFVKQQAFQEKIKLLLRRNGSENYWVSTRDGDSFTSLIDVLRDKTYLSATPLSENAHPEIWGSFDWNQSNKPMVFNLRDGKTIGARYSNFIPSKNLPSLYLPPSNGGEYCLLEVDAHVFEKLATAAVDFEVMLMLDGMFYAEQQRILDERIIEIYKEQRVSLLF